MMNDNPSPRFKDQVKRLRTECDRLLRMFEQKAIEDQRDAELGERMNERQYWILDQLRDGVRLTREMVEMRFGIGAKQAKRELSPLTRRGMVRFVRAPRPGHYVLRVRQSPSYPPPPLVPRKDWPDDLPRLVIPFPRRSTNRS